VNFHPQVRGQPRLANSACEFFGLVFLERTDRARRLNSEEAICPNHRPCASTPAKIFSLSLLNPNDRNAYLTSRIALARPLITPLERITGYSLRCRARSSGAGARETMPSSTAAPSGFSFTVDESAVITAPSTT
jgi:hypothetical protein